ncbi:MAG: NfeD family protein [Phycisphaerales bacterium]
MSSPAAIAALLLSIATFLAGGVASAAQEGEAIRAVPASRQANTVAVLPIVGEIDQITLRSLERRLREASRLGAGAVVLEIDTPGGEMLATLDICHLIRTQAPANTVAWINPKAFSAGTIIALACRDTLVHPEAVFGDAAPIQGIPIVGLRQLAPAERAKLEAPLLSEVSGSARKRGLDEKLVQSFIAVTMELWLIEEISTGDRMFVDAGEYEIAFGEPPPRLRQRGEALPQVEASAVDAGPLDESVDTDPTFLELEDASPRRVLTAADRGRWRLIGQVIGNEELLVVRADEAIGYGLASGTIADDSELSAHFGATSLVRLDETWSEVLTRFLVSWPVRLVLIVVLLVCFFIELAAPGFGVFGIAAAAALLVLVGAPALAGLAQWWEILLVLLGLGLVAVELFVLPGFGFAGVAGVACLFVGLIGTFVGGGEIGGVAWQGQLLTGIATTLAAGFAAAVSIWMLSRHLGGVRAFDRLVLSASAGGEVVADRIRSTSPPPTDPSWPRIGDVGLAASQLRPAGRAEFEARTFDVSSDGSFIDAGSRVRVVAIREGRIEVEPAEIDS